MNETIAKITAWSIEVATSGKAPTRGFFGEEFEKQSFRAKLAGKALANGYKRLGFRYSTF